MVSWQLAEEKTKKKKKVEKSQLASVKTYLNWYLSIWLSYFDYTEQLNVYDTTFITHLVIFVIKKFKIRTHFCSSTKRATKHSTILKIVVGVSQCLITRKVPRSKLVIQCLSQTSDKENHMLILCCNRKWKKLPVSVHKYKHTIEKHDEKSCSVSHACI